MPAYLWFSPQFFETEISFGGIYCIRNFKYLKSSKTSIETSKSSLRVTCPFISQISSESENLWPMTKDLWPNVGSNRTFWKTAKPFLTNKDCMAKGCISVDKHCVKNVHIRSFSGPHFPAFRLNTDLKNSKYGHFSRSEKWRLNKSAWENFLMKTT